MKTRVYVGFLALCFLAVFSLAAAPLADFPASCALSQPEYLSALADNVIMLEVRAPGASTARLTLTLSSGDGLLRATFLDRSIALAAGSGRMSLVVRAVDLARVNLFEDVTLTAAIELPDGRVLQDEVEATVVPETSPPGLSAWGVSIASRPVMVYTTRSAPVALSVANPTGKAATAKIQLAFKNASGKNPVIMATQVTLAPGTTSVTVFVPSSTATQAKMKGATTVKASLKLGDVVKAKDTASVDYDLQASASANPVSGNLPLNVTFTGSAIGGQPPYSYLWDFGDGGGSSQQTATHTYLTEGSYHPTFTVTDTLGGNAMASSTVTVSVPPLTATCSASPTSGIAPLPVTFTGSASGGTGTYAYDWNFGDGSAHATTANALHTYTAAGAYTAILTVTSGSQTKTCSQAITVTQTSITVTCDANPASGVAPLKVTFTVTATGGPSTYSYLWDFGDGATSTVQNPMHNYSSPGLYHAVVTVTSGSQTAQCQKDVSVSQVLTMGCNAIPTSGPPPLQVNFTAWAAGGIGIYSFSWNFGDGTSATGAYAIHTYTQVGNYTATLTVTSGDQKKTCSNGITVY